MAFIMAIFAMSAGIQVLLTIMLIYETSGLLACMVGGAMVALFVDGCGVGGALIVA
jgi:hypothetical protein